MSLESKIFEVRDEGTTIAVLAIRMKACNPIQEYYIHQRCGYPDDGSSIMFMVLYNGLATNDPYEWGARGYGSRTMPVAHEFILDHFLDLEDGSIIDVQYILGETTEEKVSERLVAK